MGAAESSSKDKGKEQQPKEESDSLDYLEDLELSGWKILHIFPASPCDNVGLTPYCDILTHVNRTPIEQHEQSVLASIQPYKPLQLTFFSLATRTPRTVTVTPRPWSGDGLLGLMIRHDTITPFSPLDTLHVLNVHTNSPAHEAGLLAQSDYLLGTPRWMFRGFQQLDAWLAEAERLGGWDTVLVFNSSTWRVREVRVRVRRGWGGKGSLGADVAHGWKHRLPLMEEKRAVSFEKRSFVRQGKRKETGLQREDGQLMLNLPLEAGASADDNVPLLCIRIREPEEYSAASTYTPHDRPEPKLPPPKPQDAHAGHNHSHGGQGAHGHAHGTTQAHGHSHGATQAHGHSHAGGGAQAHGHAHGAHGGGNHTAHAHSHGPAAGAAGTHTAATASAAGSKTTLTAKLPHSRSHDNSPAGPTPYPISSTGAPIVLSASPSPGITITNSVPGLQPPPSHITPPFPSLAPQNAVPTFQAGNRAAAAAAQQDFT